MIIKDIPEFDFYKIGENGQVISKERLIKATNGKSWIHKEKEMKIRFDKDGYQIVSLVNKGKKRIYPVHRLVAKTFIPTKNSENLQVNHIDGNKNNNHLSNLEWVTCKENVEHAIKHGLRGISPGEKNGGSKLTEKDVKRIRAMCELGLMKIEIADIFNISFASVTLISKRKIWKHI
jgi:hypothetical protein